MSCTRNDRMMQSFEMYSNDSQTDIFSFKNTIKDTKSTFSTLIFQKLEYSIDLIIIINAKMATLSLIVQFSFVQLNIRLRAN